MVVGTNCPWRTAPHAQATTVLLPGFLLTLSTHVLAGPPAGYSEARSIENLFREVGRQGSEIAKPGRACVLVTWTQ